MLIVHDQFSYIKGARDTINRHVFDEGKPVNQTVAVTSLYAKILSVNSELELLCLRKMGLLL
jgi:hypothetical protein